MKAVCVLCTLLLLLAVNTATAQRKRVPDSVNVVIKLHTRHPQNRRVDSVLVIFDRFDHTGAGVIKKIFHPVNNQIAIPQVPEGRYYISIFCMGLYHEYFNDLTWINKRHNNNLQYNIGSAEEYVPGSFIPAVEIDFTNLAITNFKSFK